MNNTRFSIKQLLPNELQELTHELRKHVEVRTIGTKEYIGSKAFKIEIDLGLLRKNDKDFFAFLKSIGSTVYFRMVFQRDYFEYHIYHEEFLEVINIEIECSYKTRNEIEIAWSQYRESSVLINQFNDFYDKEYECN